MSRSGDGDRHNFDKGIKKPKCPRQALKCQIIPFQPISNASEATENISGSCSVQLHALSSCIIISHLKRWIDKGIGFGRQLHRLSAVAVKNAAVGKHADGGGLWLFKRPDGGAQWVLRYTIHSRRREMGLGSASTVSLREARAAADRARALLRSNVDPIKERDRQARDAEHNLHTLQEIALDAFESRKAELKGDGLAGRWLSPLSNHILPKLGKVPVNEIDQKDIRDTLAGIWHSKAGTAYKALNRLARATPRRSHRPPGRAAAMSAAAPSSSLRSAPCRPCRRAHCPSGSPSMPVSPATMPDGSRIPSTSSLS